MADLRCVGEAVMLPFEPWLHVPMGPVVALRARPATSCGRRHVMYVMSCSGRKARSGSRLQQFHGLPPSVLRR